MTDIHPHIAFSAGFQAGTALRLASLIHRGGARPMVSALFANHVNDARRIVNATHAGAQDEFSLHDYAVKTLRILDSQPIRKHLSLNVLNPEWVAVATELFAATHNLIAALSTHSNQPAEGLEPPSRA